MHSRAAAATDSSSRERTFLHALELFDNADTPEEYRASAQEWESILSDGFRNGAIHYNIGNAYFRAGDYGRAIVNYRKAKPLRPRDSYLEANLQQALANSPGRLAEPSLPWWSHVMFWTNWFTFPQKVKITSVGFMVVATLLAIALLRGDSRIYVAGGILLTLSMVLGIDVIVSNPQGIDRAAITGETVARKGTGKDYEPAFDQPLRDGAEFTILNQTAGWTFGHFEGIGDGWIPNQFVAR